MEPTVTIPRSVYERLLLTETRSQSNAIRSRDRYRTKKAEAKGVDVSALKLTGTRFEVLDLTKLALPQGLGPSQNWELKIDVPKKTFIVPLPSSFSVPLP